MTREEAIAIFKGFKFLPREIKAVDMAIKALEQEPCEDAVSRAEVIDELNRLGRNAFKDDTDYDRFFVFLDNLLPVTPTQRWIPVSERLPKEYADVICCTDAKEVFIASYFGKLDDGTECFDDNYGMMCESDVIAWMPLPEPYKAEMESEK